MKIRAFLIMGIILSAYLLWGSAADGFAEDYVVGVDDVLQIRVLQPEVMTQDATIAPDASISSRVSTVVAEGLCASGCTWRAALSTVSAGAKKSSTSMSSSALASPASKNRESRPNPHAR